MAGCGIVFRNTFELDYLKQVAQEKRVNNKFVAPQNRFCNGNVPIRTSDHHEDLGSNRYFILTTE